MAKPEFDNIYFAYGINVNERYMEQRCGAEHYATVGPAALIGYELIFGGGEPATTRWGGAVYGLRRQGRHLVHGVCYSVSDRALERLDKKEHVTENHSIRMYTREEVDVICGAETIKALTYVASDHFLAHLSHTSSAAYEEEIKRGFYNHYLEIGGQGEGRRVALGYLEQM